MLCFPQNSTSPLTPCPSLPAFLRVAGGNLLGHKLEQRGKKKNTQHTNQLFSSETSLSCCLAFGQQAQVEMGLSLVVKTQLCVPTSVNSTSLQNPAERQGSPIFPPSLHYMAFPSFPPALPSLFGSTQPRSHLSLVKLLSGARGVYTRN